MLLQPDWVTALGLRREFARLTATSRGAAFQSPFYLGYSCGGGNGPPGLALPCSNSSKTRPRSGQWRFRHLSLSLVLIQGQEAEVIHPLSGEKSPERKVTPRKGRPLHCSAHTQGFFLNLTFHGFLLQVSGARCFPLSAGWPLCPTSLLPIFPLLSLFCRSPG